MAVTAVFGGRESFWVDELTSVCSCVRRQKGFVLAESKIVVLFDRLCINLSLSRCCYGVRGASSILLQGHESTRGCCAEHSPDNEAANPSENPFHRIMNCNEPGVLLTISLRVEKNINRKVEGCKVAYEPTYILVPLPSVRMMIWSTLLAANFS